MGISNETEVAMNDIREAMLLKRRLDLAFKIKFDNVSRENWQQRNLLKSVLLILEFSFCLFLVSVVVVVPSLLVLICDDFIEKLTD